MQDIYYGVSVGLQKVCCNIIYTWHFTTFHVIQCTLNLLSCYLSDNIATVSVTTFVLSTSGTTSKLSLFRTSVKCSCHLALSSPSLVNSLPFLLFTICTFFDPSLHNLLVAFYTPFIWSYCAASSASCATLLFSLLSFLRLLFTSMSFSVLSCISGFVLQPFWSCTIYLLL